MRKDEFPIVDKFVKESINDVLDKIKAEIESKYESIPDTFHHYETGFTDALEWVLSIIDKHKAEGEIHCTYTDSEIAKSFIDDVEAVKDLLPRAESEVSDARVHNNGSPCP